MKKIVIALDSFKGCLTSAEAGEAAAQGVHAACPECRTIVLPVADGGEGMLDVLLAASNGKRITVRAHDPLMQPCDASYGISGDDSAETLDELFQDVAKLDEEGLEYRIMLDTISGEKFIYVVVILPEKRFSMMSSLKFTEEQGRKLSGEDVSEEDIAESLKEIGYL